MKFIHYTNNIFYFTTLGLYCSLIFFFIGLMAQVCLGGIQVLLFLVLLFNLGKLSKENKQHLLFYGFLASAYLIWYAFDSVNNDDFIFFIVIVPMCIATYFTYIIYKIKEQIS